MKIDKMFAKTDESEIFKRVEEYIKTKYSFAKIQHIKLGKVLIIVKTYYGQIHLRRSDFE